MVSSPAYPDVALSVYVKTAALGWRPEGCTAGVTVLARYLRMSGSAVERGLRALTRPDPKDGVVELYSRRRTKSGGQGTTAERRIRPLTRHEPFVWVPVVASELLEPRQLRAWAALAYAQARNVKVSEGQLGQVLVHHSGKRAGQSIGASAASAVVDSLESLGWLRVHRREGMQGRHVYEVLELLDPVGSLAISTSPPQESGAQTSENPQFGDGSGCHAGNGSLATKEDPKIDRLVHEGRLNSPAVGEAQVVARKAVVKKTETFSEPVSPSSNDGLALRADTQPAPQSCRDSYTGPPLTFSPRLAWVMEPVSWLVGGVRTYVQRQFARQLSAQLAEGVEPERLRARLEARSARMSPTALRSVEGWLLKVAAARWGCHDPHCEEGVRWHSGEQCAECMAVRLELRAARERERRLEAGECPDCRTPLTDTLRCRTCKPVFHLEAPSPTTLITSIPSSSKPDPLEELPRRCCDCGAWPASTTVNFRCASCSVRHELRENEAAAMDAASASLSGPQKLAAAARACASVRNQVAAAHQAAIAVGMDQSRLDEFVLAASKTATQGWVAAAAENKLCPALSVTR